MKIAHFEVEDAGFGRRATTLARTIEGLRGVAGVVAVGSMGLMTVLYDERRTDPVVISEHILRAQAAQDAGEAPPLPRPARPPADRPMRGRHVGAADSGA